MTGRTTSALMVVVVGLAAIPIMAAAQEMPRTAWGEPDLQGVWDFRTLTPLQRPEDSGDKAFLTAEEAAEREQAEVDRNISLWEQAPRTTEAGGNVGGYNNFWMDRGTRVIETLRTSLIIDPPNGRLPELTEKGEARARINRGSFTVEFPESYTDLNSYDRCIQGFNAGPPITPAAYNQNVQIFQTPDRLVMLTEMVHTARIIPLDGQPHLDDRVQQWSGDSRGHWEGDTLVVETKNFAEKRAWRGSTDNMTLVERFRRLDADTLEYEYTVTDLDNWKAPWTVNLPMVRSDLPVFEYACHEGNYAMPNILAGARALERQTAGR